MKVGIIGLGDICQKAYLPLITCNENLSLVFCTRNNDKLKELCNKYKVSEGVTSIEDLLQQGIQCAFVHSSTDSHFEICKTLLENGIHVYVDKPISYSVNEALNLEEIAKENNLILRVGFNRRMAPMVSSLKDLGEANIVLIEKNRVNQPGDPRVFIYDDFIHVIDTLRFLMGCDYENFSIDYRMENNLLQSIVLKLSSKNVTGIGIMNRTNGITEEVMEYMAKGKKGVLRNLTHCTLYENNRITTKEFGDWENTLVKRGFNKIIESFLEDVKNNNLNRELLICQIKSHALCEDILTLIEKDLLT